MAGCRSCGSGRCRVSCAPLEPLLRLNVDVGRSRRKVRPSAWSYRYSPAKERAGVAAPEVMRSDSLRSSSRRLYLRSSATSSGPGRGRRPPGADVVLAGERRPAYQPPTMARRRVELPRSRCQNDIMRPGGGNLGLLQRVRRDSQPFACCHTPEVEVATPPAARNGGASAPRGGLRLSPRRVNRGPGKRLAVDTPSSSVMMTAQTTAGGGARWYPSLHAA